MCEDEYTFVRLQLHMGYDGVRNEYNPLLPFSIDIELWGDEWSKKVGTLRGTIVPVYVNDLCYSLLDAADAESNELRGLVQSVWDDDAGDYRGELLDPHGHGILCLEEMTIDREYRGRNIGLIAIAQTLDVIGYGMCAAVLKSHPLTNPHLGPTDAEIAVACKKLRAYYARIGFVENPFAPDYMYQDLAYKKPPTPELKIPKHSA